MAYLFRIDSPINPKSAILNPQCLNSVSVADGFDVSGPGGRGRCGRRADAIDDAPQIAVGDRFAALAEGDDGVEDLIDFRGRQSEAERLAARLHGETSGAAPRPEARSAGPAEPPVA